MRQHCSPMKSGVTTTKTKTKPMCMVSCSPKKLGHGASNCRNGVIAPKKC